VTGHPPCGAPEPEKFRHQTDKAGSMQRRRWEGGRGATGPGAVEREEGSGTEVGVCLSWVFAWCL